MAPLNVPKVLPPGEVTCSEGEVVTASKSPRKASRRRCNSCWRAFRAEVYLAHSALDDRKRVNVWKQTPGCTRVAKKIEAAVDEMASRCEGHLGKTWMNWLKDAKQSGDAFKVERMAENLGLGRWYASVYRLQSSIVHAGDATRHMDANGEQMAVDVRLGSDVEGAAADPLRPVYSLDQLLDPDFTFPTDTTDCIAQVRLTRIRLVPIASSFCAASLEIRFAAKTTRRQCVEIIRGQIQALGLTRSQLEVRQASFQLVFLNGGWSRTKTATFSVNLPSSCDLKWKSDEIREIGQRCLKRWGIVHE